MPSKHREREDKYAVPVAFILPDLSDLAGPGGRVETAEHTMVNRYVDTPGTALRGAGLTLRRRSGGPDEGWQLKLPPGPARTEVASRSRARAVPAALREIVLGVTRGQPLAPVAELTTRRQTARLLDAGGVLLAEVADDRVSSTTLGEEARLDHWREIEVELGAGGDEELLAAVGRRLVDAGAEASSHTSKLARALGLPPRAAVKVLEPSTVADLVGAYLQTQCAEIIAGDLALRLGETPVHRTRVAIRRLRSTLRIFAELLDPEPSQRLEGELTWFAGLLGEVRDREVLLERLQQQVAELAPELVLGPVAADLEKLLDGERVRHLRRLAPEMRSQRQLDLLDALVRWQTEPPFLETAQQPAKQVRGYVEAAENAMRRRLRRALADGPDQDERLHRARKAAKRARYAAELAVPGWTKAETVAEDAKRLQTELGEYQDSAVAATFLRTAAAALGSGANRNGFTYGLLLALEWQRAAAARDRLRATH